MAFRRRFRRGFRRRRKGPETYTVRNCRSCINVYGRSPCNESLTDAFLLLSMSSPRNPVSDPTELTVPANKAITLKGMKFQSLHHHDPQETQDCFAQPPVDFPGSSQLAFILTIWEAVMVLPFVQGSTTTPAYLPNLTGGSLQLGDLADRLLWKRLSHLYVQGTQSLASFGVGFVLNPDSTARYNTENPVAVKAKCRLDDRHGLFFVRSFVHDIFLPFTPKNFPSPCPSIDCDTCDDNNNPECGTIPILHDFWAKLFYSVS